jgi:hypothetical protein
MEALMRIILVMVAFLPFCAEPSAQNLLRLPESVAYDADNDRYLASNWQTGDIVAIDNQGNQGYFVIGGYCRNGVHIEGNAIYAACIDQGVKGFDLTDTSIVMHVNIEGMVNLNDLASDTSGNLYVSDVYGDKIYRINLENQSYSVLADSGIYHPNGIYFDARRNRLLVVSFMINSPIQAINLNDLTLTTIVNTGRHNLDGLTEDNSGNYYFSSWNTTSIYMYDSLFTNPPERIYTNPGGPADIFFNKLDDVLAVPVMNYNTIDFIDMSTGIGGQDFNRLPSSPLLFANYPNPFNSATTIGYYVQRECRVRLDVFDLLGRKVKTLIDGYRDAGHHQVVWEPQAMPTGVYYYSLSAGDESKSRKMLFLK